LCAIQSLAADDYKDSFLRWHAKEKRSELPSSQIYAIRCGACLNPHKSQHWSFAIYGFCMSIIKKFLEQEIVVLEDFINNLLQCLPHQNEKWAAEVIVRSLYA
jgi:hypothetical protein